MQEQVIILSSSLHGNQSKQNLEQLYNEITLPILTQILTLTHKTLNVKHNLNPSQQMLSIQSNPNKQSELFINQTNNQTSKQLINKRIKQNTLAKSIIIFKVEKQFLGQAHQMKAYQFNSSIHADKCRSSVASTTQESRSTLKFQLKQSMNTAHDAQTLYSQPNSVITDFSKYLRRSRSNSKSPSKKELSIVQTPSAAKSQISLGAKSLKSETLPLADMKIITKPITNKKCTLKKFGLTLRPTCVYETHEKEELSRICIDHNCSIEDKFGCEKCYYDVHENHKLILLEEFSQNMENKYKEYIDKAKEYQNQCLLIEQPPFIIKIYKELNKLKEYIFEQIEETKKQIIEEYRQNIRMDVVQIKEEVRKQNYMIDIIGEILNKNIFDLTNSEIETSASIYDQARIFHIDQQIKKIQYKYSKLEKQFSFSYNSFKQNIMFDIKQSFKEFALPILKEKDVLQETNNKAERIKLIISEYDKDIKDKMKTCKMLKEYIKQPELLKINTNKEFENFPYFTYFEACCNHNPNPKSNTVPIFQCCNQAYKCVKCHNKFNNHPATISKTNKSKRYCIKCFEIFDVNHKEDSPVICQECKELPL